MAWSNIESEVPGGFIARVAGDSPQVEKTAVAAFSEQTKQMFGQQDLDGRHAFVDDSIWEVVDLDDRQRFVFVSIVDADIVGYAICRFHSMIINAEGRLLDPLGAPLPRSPSEPRLLAELSANPTAPNETLECWCLEAIFVIPKFQRRGIGRLLILTAAESLGTRPEDLAYGEPISTAGIGLLSSLGISMQTVRLCTA